MKKLNKKLTLNKETIASLNDAQMGAVKGGFTYALSLGHRCRDCRRSLAGCYSH